MSEIRQENAERVQTAVTALLAQTEQNLRLHIAALQAAVDESERLVTEAQGLAKEFNRHHATVWVLRDDCGVSFARIGPLDVRSILQNMTDIKMTPCSIEPGVVVRLSPNMKYLDHERGATVALSERECQRLEKDLLVQRMPPVLADSPL